MKKYFCSLLVSLLLFSPVFANQISKHIKNANFGFKSKTSVYVLDLKNNKTLYKHNENLALNPASIIKPLTFKVGYDVLGGDYIFETALYKDCNKNIYIKLGADVLLTQKDLNELISNIKNVDYKEIYIDDSIFVDEKYPPSWLEEDKWPNQRTISPYIIDNNMVQIAINRSSLAKKVEIIQNDEYKIPIINELKIGEKQNIEITQPYEEKLGIVNLQGTISKDEMLTIPVLKPEVNFNVKLNKALTENKIVHLNKIEIKKTPQNATKIASVGHSIDEISKLILHNSNNFASEVVFRVAAQKYINSDKSATLDDAINMFNQYYKAYLSTDDVLADASGVSRKNTFKTSTLANIYSKLVKDENYKALIPTSDEGTMKDRLLFLKDNLRAKTGTMREYSSLAATFKTRKGEEVVLISIIQDSKKRKSLMKNFENTLIGTIYKEY